MTNPEKLEVTFLETKTNFIKKMFKKVKDKDSNILHLLSFGTFYEPYVFIDQNLVILDRDYIYAVDLKKFTAKEFKFLGVKAI